MFASFDTYAHQALGEVGLATFLRRIGRGDCVWLSLTETCQGRAWQWGRGLNHWDSNQILVGVAEQIGAQADLCRDSCAGSAFEEGCREKRWDRDK